MHSENLQGNEGLAKKFDWGEIVDNNKVTIALVFIGLILVGFGAFLYRQGEFGGSPEIQVLE